MALFTRKNKKVVEKKAAAKAPILSAGAPSFAVAIGFTPRITEKAGILSEQKAYTFNVTREASKDAIRRAFMEKYNVKPRKIATIHVKPEKLFVRGKKGQSAHMKKAIVYVGKNDKIDFI